jgi:hypothetical protein
VVDIRAQFHRAHISRGDFEEAEEYLRAYRLRSRPATRRAILFAAIVSYSRPFIYSRGGTPRQATSRLSGEQLKLLTASERALHATILSLRHQVLAHSDFDRKPTRLVESVGTGFLVKSKPFDLLSQEINVSAFVAMCVKMKNYCSDTMFALNRTLQSLESQP